MLHKALKLIRKYHDKSIPQTAELLGVSVSHVSEIERGRKNPSIGLLGKYADTFDMPLSAILFFAETYGKAETERAKAIRQSVARKALKMLEWVEEVLS